jgi:hypothetical protein
MAAALPSTGYDEKTKKPAEKSLTPAAKKAIPILLSSPICRRIVTERNFTPVTRKPLEASSRRPASYNSNSFPHTGSATVSSHALPPDLHGCVGFSEDGAE